MNNKECIQKLRDAQDFNEEWVGERFDAVDHAISQLERLDRLKEHISKLIDYRTQRAEDNEAVGIGSLQHRASLDTLLELQAFINGEKPHE